MSIPFSLRIFVADGDPDGLRLVERSNWVGKALIGWRQLPCPVETDGALNAVTLLEELQRRYPGDYDTSVLRTLQRRVRQWRAVYGPEREVYFAQEHPPGRLSA